MIRINLLGGGRDRGKKRLASPASVARKLTIACSLILLLGGLFCGWRYWAVTRESTDLDKAITAAQQETTRLHSIILQVQQFEQRRAQLQQRVVLIEQLKKGQTGPVHMLDQISRALPPMLWLTEVKQVGADVLVDGRCTALTGLSDFVVNLEASGYFKRSIEIISTQTETIAQPQGELIKFSIKAHFQSPAEAAVGGAVQPAAAGRTGRAGGAGAP